MHNRYQLSLLCGLLSVFFATNIQAHDGTVNIDGNITDNTCSVSPDSVNFVVALGNVASKQFNKAGDTSQFEAFTIHLENCGAGVSSVSTTFTGAQDPVDKLLLAIDSNVASSATGLGIGIYNEDRASIPLGTKSSNIPITPDQSSVSLKFYARYVATSANVTSGQANASATFILNYG